MIHSGKKHICTIVCGLIFGIIFIYSWKSHQLQNNISRKIFPPAKAVTPGGQLCRGKPAKNTITPLEDNRTFIISPYFDDREGKVTRVIGIVHHEDVKELYCWFCCQPHSEIQVTSSEIDVHSDRFGFPYGAADIVCVEPENCDPTHVSIHQSPHGNIDQLPRFEIKNRKAETFSVDFTVCISAMFGNYNNVLQFIQSMEMYKILGVQKVVVYKNSCSQLMEKVLKFYMKEGTVEIIPWPINSYLKVSSKWHFSMDAKDIGYYGQITALNDCIYRNMQRSRFVVLNDADEIILPLKHPDWKTMMSSLQEQNPGTGIFLFENHIFPETISTPVFNVSSWNTVPGVNILQHVHREPDRKEVFNPKKMIIDPRRVIQTSVHSVLRAYGTSVNVPMDVALIYHCRVPLQGNLPKESLIRDTSLWKYNSSLIMNVNKVLRQAVLCALFDVHSRDAGVGACPGARHLDQGRLRCGDGPGAGWASTVRPGTSPDDWADRRPRFAPGTGAGRDTAPPVSASWDWPPRNPALQGATPMNAPANLRR